MESPSWYRPPLRMSHVRTHLAVALGLVLVSPTVVVSPALAVSLAPPASEASTPKSSSWWLRAGEAREQQGEYAKAGDAYRQALLALSEKRQKANEGARAAMLAAEAYWQAFDRDPNEAHLEAGLAVLEQWLTLTGPGSRATMLGDVQQTYARMKAVRDPLVAVDPALTSGNAKEAAEHYDEVLDALANQNRDWSVGARISVAAANALVTDYDARVHAPKDIEPHLQELETARELLVRWKAERPADDASEQGPAVERALADVETRLAAAKQTLADEARAAQQREAARAEEARREVERREAERREQERAQQADAAAANPRTLSIVLLSTGLVATAAGAGLLGEGAVFSGVANDRAASSAAEADALEQMNGATFDRAGFDAELDQYRADVARRNLGMIIGGSVLAVGGLATSVAGIVLLTRARRASGSKRSDRARLAPVVSPTQLQLSISGRF